MTKKDFFRIIIKLFGLYWIVTSIYNQLPYIFSIISKGFDSYYLPYALGYFLVCISIFVLLVFYTDRIIKWLKLEKGYDEDKIDFSNFNTGNIIKLALIIFSFMLIINNVSTFFTQTYYVVRLRFSMNLSDTVNYIPQSDYAWAKSFIDMFIGYIILTNYPAISRFLLKITQKNEG